METEQGNATAVERHLAAARRQAECGNFEGCIRECDEALRLQPGSPVAYMLRAWALRETRSFLKAIRDYNQVIRLRPDEADAFWGRASSRSRLRDYRGAVDDCNEALRLQPDHALAYDTRGYAWEKLNNLEAAIDDFSAAIGLGYSRARIDRGRINFQAGRYPEALHDLNEAIADFGSSGELFHYRGLIHLETGDWETALDDFLAAIDLGESVAYTDIVSGYLGRGDLRMEEGLFETAQDDYEEALEIVLEQGEHDPYTPNLLEAIYLRLGITRNHLEDPRGALESFGHALRLAPDNPECYRNRADALAALGDYHLAIADYTRALEKAPDNSLALAGRAACLAIRGDLDAAEQDMTAAVEHAPTSVQVLCGNGCTRLMVGDYRGALDDFDRVVRLDPGFVPIYSYRARALMELGYFEEALGDLERATWFEPVNFLPYLGRASTLSRMGLDDRALDEFTMSLRLNSDCADAYMGRSFCFLGRSREETMADLHTAASLYLEQGEAGQYLLALERLQEFREEDRA